MGDSANASATGNIALGQNANAFGGGGTLGTVAIGRKS